MKNTQSKITDNQIKNDINSIFGNKIIKTTNINVLLNRVRLEKKDETKKIILSISIIVILSFISIIVLGN